MPDRGLVEPLEEEDSQQGLRRHRSKALARNAGSQGPSPVPCTLPRTPSALAPPRLRPRGPLGTTQTELTAKTRRPASASEGQSGAHARLGTPRNS